MGKIDLSVIVPFYNEEENLGKLHRQLMDVLKKMEKETEVIYVNDGSSDNSLKVLKREVSKIKEKSVFVKIIVFRRNFGQTAAISAGIKSSQGRLISFLDADLQNDPADIPRFLKEIKKGYDAVFGWRRQRKDATVRSILSRAANVIIGKVFSYPYHDVGCSARVVKRKDLEKIELYGELHRILPVLIYLKGAKIGEIVVKHRYRRKGKSKYGFNRIVKTVVDIITIKFLSSYGTRPAYVFGSIGLASMFFGVLTSLVVAYKKLFLGVFVHRDPLFLVTIFLVLLGMQFVLMGLLAELQVRTYFELQDKPTYEIEKIIKT